MGEREFNYDEDQNRDYSDLSDQNQSALGRAQEKWGDAQVFNGGKNYDANSLAQMENSGVSNSRTDDAQTEAASVAASNRFNYTGGGTHKSRNAGTGKGGFFKSKKAAILGGGGLVAASGGFMLFSFFGTLVAPIHIMEIITEKLGFSGISTDLHIDKYWSAKMRAKGTKCRTQFYCRFSQISDKQIKNLEKAGFKVDVEDGTFGKKKITKLTHIESGKVVPNDTKSIKTMMRDPQVKASWDKGYKGHFHTFLDKANKKFKSWFKVRGAKPNNKGKTADEIIDDDLKESNEGSGQTKTSQDPEADFKGVEEADGNDGSKLAVGDEERMLDHLKEDGEAMKGKTNAEKLEISNGNSGAFKSKIESASNNIGRVCMFFTGISLVVSGIKMTKFAILIMHSFKFLSMASKIKHNLATTEEVQSLGDPIMGIETASSNEKQSDSNAQESGIQKMFKFFASTNSSQNYKSFTEGQGWRATAYNDSIGSLDSSAENYTTGLTGKIGKFIENLVSHDLFKFGKKACKVITTAIAAVALITAASCILTAGIGCIVQAISAAGVWGVVSGILGFISGLFENQIMNWARATVGSILAGDFLNKKTLGQDYGNAIISGAGATMSKNAMAGGSSTLNKSQAIALYFENEKMIAEKGQYERTTRSPFDITSHHTFLGSIMANTLPYQRQMATVGGIMPSIFSMAGRAFSSIMPNSHANDAAGFGANLEVCDDKSIRDTGAVTDIFCNPIAGVDVNVAKNMEFEDIVDRLIELGDLADGDTDNAVSLAKNNLKKYIESCYDRKVPIGVPVTDDGNDYGENCNKDKMPNADLYASFMNYIRIDEGLESTSGSTSSVDSELAGMAGDFSSPIKGFAGSELKDDQDFGSRILNGEENQHMGIDIARPTGTPVHSIADGKVFESGAGSSYSGSNSCGDHTVVIEHSGKIFSLYCHMSAHSVNVGDIVKKGQQIGAVGNEGYSFGAHLHLEVHKGGFGPGKEVDPRPLLGGI